MASGGPGNIINLSGNVELNVTGAIRGLNQLDAAGRNAGNTLNSAFAAMRNGLLKFVGAQAALQAVSGAISGAVGSAMTFEQGIRNLNVILKLSETELSNYAERMRTLGTELGINVSATEAVKAAYDVAQAGFTNAADNALVMEAALKAASAGGVDASVAANLLSSTLRSYGKDASEAAAVSDIYFKAVESGIVTVEQLARGIGGVNAVAAQAGIPLEEIAAAVATATNQGIRASTTFDGIRGALSNLIAPSEVAKKEMAKYGLVIDENTLRQKGLVQTLLEITQKTGGSAEAMRRILGDVQAFSVALSIVSKDGKIAAENIDAIKKASGSTEKALEEARKTFTFAFDQMKIAVESLGISLVQSASGPGAAAMRWITDLVTSVDKMVASFNRARASGGLFGAIHQSILENFPATVQMLKELRDLIVEFAAQFTDAGDAGDAVGTTLDAVFSSILAIVKAFVAILYEAVDGLGYLSSAFGGAVNGLETGWAKATEAMKILWDNFTYHVQQVFVGMIDIALNSIKKLPLAMQLALGDVRTSLKQIRSDLAQAQKPAQGAGAGLSKLGDALSDPFQGAARAMDDRFQNQQKKRQQRADNKAAQEAIANALGALGSSGFGKAKDQASSAPPPPEEGGVPDPDIAVNAVLANAEALKHEIAIGKVAKQEAVARYRAIYQAAKEANVPLEEQHRIEKALYDLQVSIAKETDKTRIERIKNIKGETAGLLEALEVERRERMKAGVDSIELEAWYGSQRQAIFKKDAEAKAEVAKKSAKLERETQTALADELKAQDKPTEAALLALEAEKTAKMQALKEIRDEIIKDRGDRVKAERDYQAAVLAAEESFNAQRLKITREGAKERKKAEDSARGATLRNEAATEKDPDKARKKELEADHIDRLQQIREQVEAYRQAGVEQTVIDRFIASEQKKIREEGKAEKDGEDEKKASSDPRQSFEEAFGGLSTLGFSIGGGGRKRRKDPVAEAAANKLAGEVGKLATETPGATEGVNDTITINIVDGTSKQQLFSDTVHRGGDGKIEMGTEYQLGRLV